MADDSIPSGPEVDDPESKRLGRLAHSMNNSIAYVVTNLNLLTEELERLELTRQERNRILQLVDAATEGAAQVHLHIRRLKVLSWGERPEDEDDFSDNSEDDTWDEGDTNARILVVDDEEQILRAIGRALRTYDVTTANSGQRAIDLISEGAEYDLILCDLIMRDVSGIDVFNWLKKNKRDHVERVLFITAGAFTSELREFLASVRNQVLHKPFDTKTLRWMVAQKLHTA